MIAMPSAGRTLAARGPAAQPRTARMLAARLLAYCVLAYCVLASCALGLLITGCSAASNAGTAARQQTAEAVTTGRVTGRFVMEGGPLGPGEQQPGTHPLPGTVTFTEAGHPAVSVSVPAAGTFSVALEPGRYQVTGRSPKIEVTTDSGPAEMMACSLPQALIIAAGHAATITVVCALP